MTSLLFALLVSTHAHAAEPPCPATGSGPIGSAHYCTDANGNATCTLVMNIPFVGIIETTVTASSESECNDYVTASSSNGPTVTPGQVAQSVRMKVDTPDVPADLLDLTACSAELAFTKDRLEAIEHALGVPDDYSTLSVSTDSELNPTELTIEAAPDDGAEEIESLNYLEVTLTAE